MWKKKYTYLKVCINIPKTKSYFIFMEISIEVSWHEKEGGSFFVNLSCLPALLNSSCLHKSSTLSDLSVSPKTSNTHVCPFLYLHIIFNTCLYVMCNCIYTLSGVSNLARKHRTLWCKFTILSLIMWTLGYKETWVPLQLLWLWLWWWWCHP